MSQTTRNQDTNPAPAYLSIEAFARWTRLPPEEVQKAIEDGEIPAQFHREQWWVDVTALRHDLLSE